MTIGLRSVLVLSLVTAVAGLVSCFLESSPESLEHAQQVVTKVLARAFEDTPWAWVGYAMYATGGGALSLSLLEWSVVRGRRTGAAEDVASSAKIRETIAETQTRAQSWLRAEPPDVIQAFDALMRGAVAVGASDVHFSPTPDRLTITYRVEGTLYEVIELPPALGPRLTVRAKVLARLDTHVRNVPQDGRMVMSLNGRKIDARMSSLPTDSGERVVLRLVRGGRTVPELDALGFGPDVSSKLREILSRSQGMLFVTGVVGSGKTTSLYAGLHEISRRRGSMTSIVTLEDPIELELPFATQTQINTRTGMTFATALRSALRQDPNVLMVGEIRDRETADVAAQAALTGHLILTTVHADTAAGPFARLIELEVEPFVLASATAGCLSQRLLRTLCTACRREQAPEPIIVEQFARRGYPLPPGRYFEPMGCDYCDGSGFSGRVPIAELLVVGPEVRKAIHDRRPTNEIYAIAVAQGMTPLLQDGLTRALSGETSLGEVLRALG